MDANVWVAAFDPRDPFHAASVTFLQEAISRGERFLGPAFLFVEVGCAVARRSQDAALGRRASLELRTNPALALESLATDLLEEALEIGTDHRLRAADALYAATAERTGSSLVTWDQELLQRFRALTPDQWVAQAP